MNIALKILLGVVAVGIVGALIVVATGSSDEEAATPSPSASASARTQASPSAASQNQTVSVRFTGSAFEPSSVTVPMGGKLEVKNDSSKTVEPSSDPHPSHTIYPALTIGSLSAGQSGQTEALTKAGTWGMHDHNNPTIKLSVTVK